VRVEESVQIAAPPERVWELISDPADYPRLLDWVDSFDPQPGEGDQDEQEAPAPEVGGRYEMRVKVGSASVGGVVEIVEYEPQRDIVWTSITGVEQRGRLRLRPWGRNGSRLTMRISYGAPGALYGTLAELLSVPQINRSIKRSLQNVKLDAEGKERPAPSGPGLPARALHEVGNLAILAKSGMVAPMRPDKVAKIAWVGARWRGSPATEILVGAIRHPNRALLVDELGPLTYRQADEASNALARALGSRGIGQNDRVAIMCRDHRGFVEGVFATAKLGADVLLLNTSFSAPQLTEVCQREEAAAILYDEEFEELTREAGNDRERILVWHENGSDEPRLGDLIEQENSQPLPPPGRTARITILTSGTTGTPKGATRTSTPLTLDPPASLLDRIPQRENQIVRIGAPLFHTWGLSNFALGLALGSTFILRRRFDPEECLADIEAHRCQVLVVVPVMLQRILELPEETKQRYDTSSLRVVAASGSALPGDLSTRWMEEFGENLYNVYGSTEVAAATVATPRDLRRAPGTAGRAARGSIIRLFDEDARPVPQGEAGRIFVGNAMLFEGYTGGEDKDRIAGLMATGDVGRFDEAGRLFVEGRDDEMIVSGGENVFPKEVEDVLTGHPAVAEAAAIGVDDGRFGQRLRAFVVLRDGQQVSEEDLQDHVRKNLARYKTPREVFFVRELPRNSTGKILKRDLAELEPEEATAAP
jgi:acyl-CoA synthetase (AMP-forming)/AMP-acid ligase II/uncharacterized membrane protein